ncbi:gliding motility-associated lipoprotein GldH [Chitinophaga costaii]|uniref:Gliding motility-associated lipoprotein GldH n=2 Tax=Chitinophaga costaii TaxID=1335309 RepID=A0A1C4AMV2_9BACT|nr:gliding motility lipoprotein GldH [Chitinophaga costaii]SCB95929.1 gliding motility-associated lipoprotein GldH [Chitinophaga costaii]
MYHMNKIYLAVFVAGCCAMAACQPMKMDTYEKNVDVPHHQWSTDFKPEFQVTLQPQDTVYLYNLYVNVRHKDAYPYSNIWVIITTQFPGAQPIAQRVELPLEDETGKWLGSGVDDIYEHRIPIQRGAILNRAGTYKISFEQNMRQNPLPDILNVGLRVEKAGHR